MCKEHFRYHQNVTKSETISAIRNNCIVNLQIADLHKIANMILSKVMHIFCRTLRKLEALRECKPPWPRQIITPILPTVKMLSLGGERLPPFKKKVLDYYLHHDLGMSSLLWCFFAQLLILDYPDQNQNVISSSLYYPGPLHKISFQSIHNFLSNVVHRQTDRQTNKQTNQCYQNHNLLCQGGN